MSASEVDRLTTSQFAWADERARELDASSENASQRLTVFLAEDSEGDKSAAGEVQPSTECITVADPIITNAIVDDIEQGDASNYEGNALLPSSSAARIVTWECEECWRRFDLHIDDPPDCCPRCESPNIKEIPGDVVTFNGDEPPGSEIPEILIEAARIEDNLEALRNKHKTGALLDEDAASPRTGEDQFG